jgi:hypothetical protein
VFPFAGLTFGAAIKGVGAFIAANWKIIAIIAVIGLAYWRYSSMVNQIEELKDDNEDLSAMNDYLKADNKQLNKILTTNNKAVDAIADLATDFDRRMGVLGKRLGIQQSEFNKRLDNLNGQAAPINCQQSEQFVIDNAPYLRTPK